MTNSFILYTFLYKNLHTWFYSFYFIFLYSHQEEQKHSGCWYTTTLTMLIFLITFVGFRKDIKFDITMESEMNEMGYTPTLESRLSG